MGAGWQGSNRRQQLPSNWRELRAKVFKRDDYQCTWTADGVRCMRIAEECDHIGDRLDHSMRNLRSLCGWHHARRTSAQGNQARVKLAPRVRPLPPHPGLKTN